MVALLGEDNFTVEHIPGKSIMVIEKDIDIGDSCVCAVDCDPNSSTLLTDIKDFSLRPAEYRRRVLHLVHGDLLETPHLQCADIVMLETDFPEVLRLQLTDFDNILNILLLFR